jgi:hypothetical protein
MEIDIKGSDGLAFYQLPHELFGHEQRILL